MNATFLTRFLDFLFHRSFIQTSPATAAPLALEGWPLIADCPQGHRVGRGAHGDAA